MSAARCLASLAPAVILVFALSACAHAAPPPSAPQQSISSAGDDVQDLLFFGPVRPLILRLHITVEGQPFRARWRARFDELFAQADRDGDKKLKLAEGHTLVREMNGALRDVPLGELTSTAADGTIDRDTLLAHIEKYLPPFSVRRRPVIAAGSALALFPLLDTDHNQALSAAELAAAETQLAERDFDDDRVITPAELILDPNAIAAAADPNSANRDLDAEGGSLVAIDPSLSLAQIADKVLTRYDRDRDGSLSTRAPKIEIGLPPALLSKLDRDSDGLLTREELSAFADRRFDLELTLAMGKAGKTGGASRRRQRVAVEEGFRVRETLLGGFKLRLGDAEIDLIRNNRDPQQTDLVTMRAVDRDQNGYIDPAEAATANIGKVTFAAMDSDSDGKVFKGELSTFMGEQNAAAAVRLQLQIMDLGQDLFGTLDQDEDGVLSSRELRHAPEILQSEDKNGDGSLGGDELPERLKFELARGVDERAEAEMRSQRRPERSAAKSGSAGPLWFRKMDRNNDGDLSVSEFIGPLATFQKLDADHDGLIDQQEAESAGK